MSHFSKEQLLRVIETLSVGLIFQSAEVKSGTASVLLPNDSLRHGWEQLCYLCFQTGELPPRTLPEFVRWLHQPVEQWNGIGVSFQTQNIWGVLLEYGQPTDWCRELGGALARQPNPRLVLEDENFQRLYTACRALGDEKLYTNARKFILTHPVLKNPFEELLANIQWGLIRAEMKACYEPIPRASVRDEQIVCCPYCGWALEWRGKEARCHPEGSCVERAGDLSQSNLRYPYDPDMLRTKAGVQRYVVAPEIALMQLYRRLRRKGNLHCRLYPAYDAYDLRIMFPDGQIWAIDLKDQRDPKRLALELNRHPFRRDPKWDRAFYLFPKDRGSATYQNVFANFWMSQDSVSVMHTAQFMRRVNRKLGA